jgi:glycerol-3-phosphate dehydrogenase
MRDAAVIGGGVVGCAVVLALARRGADVVLLEAEDDLARGASGTNSGILHTGFDSGPGELETQLILRSAALRDEVLDALGVPVIRCGATLRPRDERERTKVAALAENAATNGVRVERGEGDALEVPGESVTDPVAYTRALAAAAQACGAEVRCGAPVTSLRPLTRGVEVNGELCRVAVNCAGLFADEIARLAGDASFEIYPRKGEFFVFEAALDRILLPVPDERTKGVLVFPTVDGHVVAGPTAIDLSDKRDRSVRPQALAEIRAKVDAMLPGLGEPVHSYAGLRPAGRGVNYLIGRSPACPALVNVAAIRSTGLSASLGIAECVAEIIGLPGDEAPLPELAPVTSGEWWR